MITKVHFLAVIVCVPTFRKVSHGVLSRLVWDRSKTCPEIRLKIRELTTITRKRLAPPHSVFPPFFVDTKKKHYTASGRPRRGGHLLSLQPLATVVT